MNLGEGFVGISCSALATVVNCRFTLKTAKEKMKVRVAGWRLHSWVGAHWLGTVYQSDWLSSFGWEVPNVRIFRPAFLEVSDKKSLAVFLLAGNGRAQ